MCWDSFVVCIQAFWPSVVTSWEREIACRTTRDKHCNKDSQTYLLSIIGPDGESEAILQVSGSSSQRNVSCDLPKLSRALLVPEDVHMSQDLKDADKCSFSGLGMPNKSCDILSLPYPPPYSTFCNQIPPYLITHHRIRLFPGLSNFLQIICSNCENPMVMFTLRARVVV